MLFHIHEVAGLHTVFRLCVLEIIIIMTLMWLYLTQIPDKSYQVTPCYMRSLVFVTCGRWSTYFVQTLCPSGYNNHDIYVALPGAEPG